jgi:glucan phosphoethanolaminetransferase (alkaline phosphatase superfamily)
MKNQIMDIADDIRRNHTPIKWFIVGYAAVLTPAYAYCIEMDTKDWFPMFWKNLVFIAIIALTLIAVALMFFPIRKQPKSK